MKQNIKPGKTELVRLVNIEKEFSLANEIYAKNEASNPSGSIKDRAVYQMLLDYQADGTLIPGGVIVEATSGNTGISLSYFAKIFNYKAVIVMPSSMSVERRNMIASYGATLVLVDGGMKESNLKALEIVNSTPNSFIFNQFKNPSNPKAHYLETAKEIDESLKDIDYIVAGIGTGGTITGIGKYFKERNYKTRIIGVEPFESPLLNKGQAGPHKIQGIGANFIPDILDLNVVDEILDIKGDEAIKNAYLIKELDNISCGYSSGASLGGALELIKKYNLKNKKIVVIFPDSGNRYKW